MLAFVYVRTYVCTYEALGFGLGLRVCGFGFRELRVYDLGQATNPRSRPGQSEQRLRRVGEIDPEDSAR